MHHYIRFEAPINSEPEHKSSNIFKLLFFKLLIYIIKAIIPMANPDYENKIDDVKFWLLEFDGYNSLPVREIGLNENQQPIVKMPYKNNYGYWTDNNLKLEDFYPIFVVEEIGKEYFIQKWNDLI